VSQTSADGCESNRVKVDVTINQTPVFTSPIPSTITVESGDAVTGNITVTDDGAGGSLVLTTKWKLTGESTWRLTALPTGVTLTANNPAGANSQTWVFGGNANLPLGIYIIEATVTDGQCPRVLNISLDVKCDDDLEISYTGLSYVQTASTTNTSAQLTMSATITDSDGGDIRNASVSFIVTGPGGGVSVSGSPANSTVALVSSDNTAVGTATGQVTLNLGSEPCATFQVEVRVGGRYCGTMTIPVAAALPNGDFITGGGSIMATASTGSYAADNNNGNQSRINFGFNCKYTKSGKNLQGNANVIFRKGGKVYQIKSNAVQSLSVNATTKTSTFITRANLSEIVNGVPVQVNFSSYLLLRIDIVDKGEPGISNDEIGITVSVNGGGMIFSSNWVNGNTARKTLATGNLVVRGGGLTCTTCTTGFNAFTGVVDAINQVSLTSVESEFNAKISPNPSNNVFNLTFTGGTKEKLDVTVLDVSGRTVKSYKVDPIGTFKFGDGLRPGIYMIQVKQGTSNRIFKVIKQ
jgi:hypothetical protein